MPASPRESPLRIRRRNPQLRRQSSLLSFATEQDESRPPENFSRKPTRDPATMSSPFSCVIAPTIPQMTAVGGQPRSRRQLRGRLTLRRGNSGVNDFDLVGRNSRFHHGCLHRLGDGDERVHTMPVLESNLFRRERDATGHDETGFSFPEERDSRDRM